MWCCYFCRDQAFDEYPCGLPPLPHVGVELPVVCFGVVAEEEEDGTEDGTEGGAEGRGGGGEGGEGVDGATETVGAVRVCDCVSDGRVVDVLE